MLKLMFIMRCKTSFIAKEVFCCKLSMNAWFKESFQYRVLNYFENKLKNQQPSHQCTVSTKLKENFHNLDNNFYNLKSNSNVNEKLQTIYQNFNLISTEKDQQIVEDMINNLDLQCFSLISSLKFSDILYLINAFLKVAPRELPKTYFYDKSLSILIKSVENNCLANHEIVQLLYFISLRKEHGAHYINYLKPYVPDMKNLPLIEKCITAESFYKVSAKFQLRQSRILEQVLEQEFKQLINDPHLLSILCKAIVFSEPSHELTLKNLSNIIIEWQEPLNFESTVYLLSLYAEALLLEPKAIDQLVKNGITAILQDTKNCLTLKDIDTFLWSISYLGLTLTTNEKLILRTCLERRIDEYKTRDNLGILINSILCLQMLRCWSTKVIKICLKERLFESIFTNNFHWKIKSRLQLLISQITLEMKMYVHHSLLKQIKIGYVPSENIKKVIEVAYTLINKKIIENAIIECPIETLIIPGVTVFTKHQTYHIDVLDDSTCLKNTNIPHGLTNLKLRLLSRLRYRQILIPREVFKKNPETVHLIIEQKIRNYTQHGKAAEFFSSNSL